MLYRYAATCGVFCCLLALDDGLGYNLVGWFVMGSIGELWNVIWKWKSRCDGIRAVINSSVTLHALEYSEARAKSEWDRFQRCWSGDRFFLFRANLSTNPHAYNPLLMRRA